MNWETEYCYKHHRGFAMIPVAGGWVYCCPECKMVMTTADHTEWWAGTRKNWTAIDRTEDGDQDGR